MQPTTESHIKPAFRTTLPANEWQERQKKHKQVLSDILDPYLEKRSRQVKNPVLDFLFEYYHFRPAHLMRWSPGTSVALEAPTDPESWPEISELTIDSGIAYLDPENFPENRKESAVWILELLQKSAEKKPSFGCFGMHEWAMVYKAGEIRHNQVPLRMEMDQLAEFVESRPLVCTHFDAFRFFTEKARPMNKYELSRQTFTDNEQSGCIHTNMDLYKWAFKLYPWIPGDLIREAFLLAVEARYIDMQASPYDLRLYGLEPIRIETEEGRKKYLTQQKKIYEKGQQVRDNLISEYSRLIQYFSPDD